jgi:hypothetical protein
MLRYAMAGVVAALVMSTTASDATASCAARTRITGIWKGNDGGTYHIRRVGNNVVWWVGFSSDGGDTWTNVFKGVLDERAMTIKGEWADARSRGGWKDGNEKAGQITLEVIGKLDSNVQGFRKVQGTGWNFGADNWGPTCN